MVATTLEQQILESIRQLDDQQKREVLNFARALENRPKGMTGEESIAFASPLHFDHEDLRLIEQAIEEDCERIDIDGWQ